MIPSLNSLAKHIDTNTAVTILCTICIIYVTLGNRKIGHEVRAGVTANTALMNNIGDRDEKLILDFMTRTVDRWDKLQRDNPNVKVPYIEEPMQRAHLNDGEMNRSSVTIEPSPIPDKRRE